MRAADDSRPVRRYATNAIFDARYIEFGAGTTTSQSASDRLDIPWRSLHHRLRSTTA
jgi:hypothetical protein